METKKNYKASKKLCLTFQSNDFSASMLILAEPATNLKFSRLEGRKVSELRKLHMSQVSVSRVGMAKELHPQTPPRIGRISKGEAGKLQAA